jgi:hypothetical protein
MNKITKIFNNIGFYCSINQNIIVPNKAIVGYKLLEQDSIGYFIPYLIRNTKDGYKWEIGVGEVKIINSFVCVERVGVSSSSNNNQKTNFIGNENEFYLFVNNSNFNSSFNNVILKNDHFNIDNVTSIYLVDNSEKTIDCVLPPANDARNVVIDVKALSSNHNVKVRCCAGEILGSTNDSIRLVSDGQSWYVMNSFDATVNFSQLSDNDTFSSLSSPNGDDYSFQYKDGNSLEGSNLYWDSGNSNKLLLGADNENAAHTIIPTSGSEPVIFNKDLQASDFIVYGSGQSYRNLFFSYDGRVGINIPSGSRPQTIFHVVNYSCSEILRLENRTSCQPAKLTLYHKPSILNNGNTCSILNLAGRDSAGNQKDYAQIYSVAKDVSVGNGGLVLSISSQGSTQQPLISGDLNNIVIGYDNNKKIDINNNGTVIVSGSNINVRALSSTFIGTNNASVSIDNNNISLSHSSLNLGNGNIVAGGNITFNNVVNANNIRLTNIAPSSLLTIDNTNRIVPISGININTTNNSLVLNNIESNKLLSVDSNKNIVGLYDLDDYFLTERDITWNKYSPRPANVCLKQVVFDPAIPSVEFSIGDQIEILTDAGFIYRIIENIIYSNNDILELLLDQNVTTNSTSVSLVSVTKGGYLSIEKSVTGAVSDSTSNILSIRPLTETVFNTAQKDIDFTIYGTDIKPALKVHANVGSVTRASGIYYKFATQNDVINSIIINVNGIGLSNTFSTANYAYTPTDNLFAAKVSSVGSNGKASYYGTYDQNGNVKEWLESNTLEEVAQQQFVAGGSFNTSNIDNSNSLRNIESLIASGVYEDVGFRIASITNIADSLISNLGLSFVNVINSNNIADNNNILFNGADTFFENLGVVDTDYRIGVYEITNSQYTTFLNSVATGLNNPITSDLYHPNMSGVMGGINSNTGDITVSYTVKNNMSNKPVNFVSYINSLKFINWLENGAPSVIDPSELNEKINQGAYQILLAGNNYYISTNKNRKYFLPSLNQWHKAAYFEYKDSILISGSPVVTIGTDNPYIVATEKITDIGGLSTEITQNPRQILANLTVSGWLVVDKIVVRDGTVSSSLADIGFVPDILSDPDDNDFSGGSSTSSPPTGNPPPLPRDPGGSKHGSLWNDITSIRRKDGVYGEKTPPLIPDGTPEMSDLSCDDEELINTNNLPFWCLPDGRVEGPRFY